MTHGDKVSQECSACWSLPVSLCFPSMSKKIMVWMKIASSHESFRVQLQAIQKHQGLILYSFRGWAFHPKKPVESECDEGWFPIPRFLFIDGAMLHRTPREKERVSFLLCLLLQGTHSTRQSSEHYTRPSLLNIISLVIRF